MTPSTNRRPVARTVEQIASDRAARCAQRRALMEPLRAALAERSRSRKWLAEQLEDRAHIFVSQQTVSNYLNGHAAMLRDTLTWMCAIADVPLKNVLRSKIAEAFLLQANPHPTRYRPRTDKIAATPS